eukprot:2802551-Prymnesium_polylepis.1
MSCVGAAYTLTKDVGQAVGYLRSRNAVDSPCSSSPCYGTGYTDAITGPDLEQSRRDGRDWCPVFSDNL